MKFMHNTPPWVDSIRANFDYIAKKLLPSSSADDNGKVLTVVDGEWAAAPASGGGSLTLYGPYIFTNGASTTLTPYESSPVDLNRIYSYDRQTSYKLTPELMENIILMPYCSNTGNNFAAFKDIILPGVYGDFVIPMSIFLIYVGDENNKTVYSETCEVTVYTNIELPVDIG